MKKLIRITCKEEGNSEPWVEDYNRVVDDPQKWAENIVEESNRLSPDNPRRHLLKVEVIDKETADKEHTWEEYDQVRRRKILYHLYRCSKCGITGNRRHDSEQVRKEPRFQLSIYDLCVPRSNYKNPLK